MKLFFVKFTDVYYWNHIVVATSKEEATKMVIKRVNDRRVANLDHGDSDNDCDDYYATAERVSKRVEVVEIDGPFVDLEAYTPYNCVDYYIDGGQQ